MSSNPSLSPASAWLREHLEAIRRAAELGPVVDLACGRGRNALYLAEAGVPVIGFDRNPDHLRELAVWGRRSDAAISAVRCDLETEHGIPVAAGSCGAILVFRFLFRPLAPAIERALAPGGIVLYETFAMAHRKSGRGPGRREFYLDDGELVSLFPNLEVLALDEGPDGGDPADITGRLLARRPI